MEKSQKINCSVKSCKYNDCKKKICELDTINITPNINVHSGDKDESKCSSYKCDCK